MPEIYRLRGKHHLFTWSDVDDTWTHLEVFEKLDGYAPIRKCIIAEEPHQNGVPHYHAYVVWERSLDRNLTTQLDIRGKRANVQNKPYKKQQLAAATYVRKDENWIEYGDWDDHDEDPESKPDIIEMAENSESFTEFVRQAYLNNVPAGYVTTAWRCVNDGHMKEEFLEGDPWDGVIVSTQLQNLQFDPEAHRCLILEGPPLLGKTAWAILRMPRPLLVIRHPDQLRQIKPGFHKSIIMDDYSLMGNAEKGMGRWPANSQKHFCDWDLTSPVHLRYSCATIPRHLHKCFTCNPEDFPVDINHPAIARRVTLIKIHE